MLKRMIVSIMLLVLTVLLLTACNEEVVFVVGSNQYKENGVEITNEDGYFRVTLDYRSNMSPKQMGEAYMRGILEVIPDFEQLVDSYLSELINNNRLYSNILARVSDIRNQVPQQYKDEIEGMASQLSGTDKSVRNDKRISVSELYLFNLTPDTFRGTMCSAVSVFGARSETGKTITARNLDWYPGNLNQLPQIQSVMVIDYGDKKICSVGYLGFMGIITGINDSKVFAAVLDSGTGDVYSSQGKRSYLMDLRYALENETSLDEVAGSMKDPSKYYAYNHDIFLSNPDESMVLENNFIIGSDNQRELRTSHSKLNKGVEWDISDSIGCVNSFVLQGNFDNHTSNDYNTKRWKNMQEELEKQGDTVTVDELKQVAAFDGGTPGTFADSGDLYNRTTQQIIVFEPDSYELQVFFHPRDTRDLPEDPDFIRVPVF